MLNCYEYQIIKNNDLPLSWQSPEELNSLEKFLQQNWEQRSIYYDDKNISSKQKFLAFLSHNDIKTQNYIGTIAFKGEQINIFPKMFDVDESLEKLSLSHLMKNLVGWIEYCNKISYPFINITADLAGEENLKELFIALYIRYVKNAIDRGVYYEYVNETSDCASIKGRFNTKDYIINKIPNGMTDKFECTYPKFEFDNKINRIIKCTCKLLLSETKGNNNKILRQILTRLKDVSDVKCVPRDCDNIRLSKLHRHYSVIIGMSKMFLINQMASYSLGITDAFCFLFPAEVLFEGFIGGFIQEVVSSHGGKVCLQASYMSLFDNITIAGKDLGPAIQMRYDILVEINGKVFILDTKYKSISRFENDDVAVLNAVTRDIKVSDVYQVCEYARKRGLNDVYLLYPLYRFEEDEPDFPIGNSVSEDGSTIRVHFVRLPFIFEDDDNIKNRLKSIIEEIIGLV